MLLKAIEVLPASVDADVCRKRPVALLDGEHVLRRLVQRGARVVAGIAFLVDGLVVSLRPAKSAASKAIRLADSRCGFRLLAVTHVSLV